MRIEWGGKEGRGGVARTPHGGFWRGDKGGPQGAFSELVAAPGATTRFKKVLPTLPLVDESLEKSG
jgi:hypothetical protein